jgi:predicted esterase
MIFCLNSLKDHRFPVFFGHGKSDNIVPNNFGRVSADALKSSGFDVTWKGKIILKAINKHHVS